ncbi:MAG: helix-turn-helix domain-containing protein [Thermoplasmatota archaeon]
MRLKFLRVHQRCVIYARAEPSALNDVAAWMAEWAGSKPQVAPGATATVMRVVTDHFPAPFDRVFTRARVGDVFIAFSGRATLVLSGAREDIIQFAQTSRRDASVLVKSVASVRAPPSLLTASQERLLQIAVDAGYYSIPRTLNLRALARLVGRSPSAVSELLRNAEARLLTKHVRAMKGATEEDSMGPALDADEMAFANAFPVQ